MTPIDTVLQKGHFCCQKYYLTKLSPNINGTLQKWHIKTYIIGFLKYYEHPANRTYSTIRRKLEKHDFKIP